MDFDRVKITFIFFFSIIICVGSVRGVESPGESKCGIDAIYNFGDSISDTGNLILESRQNPFLPINKFPYGETYFGRPTGRCSNGRLMLDFIANYFGLPFIPPYLNKKSDFSKGVNFAVAGATALGTSFFEKNMIPMIGTNSSLDVQLEWFKIHLKSVCSSEVECKKLLDRSLFLIGEIGGNDYNRAFFFGKSLEEISQYVPNVVQAIAGAVRTIILSGGRNIAVPGNFPIGCLPSYLTLFATNHSSDYDSMKCLIGLNNFSQLHNSHLQEALKNLSQEYPKVTIMYFDYYNAFKLLLGKAPSLGFNGNSLLKCCCGVGGNYNFDIFSMCGNEGVPVCPNPSQYLHWDGIHFTEESYKRMVDEFIQANSLQRLKC